MPNHFTAYPEFYTNPAILKLADKKRWTISNDKKMPLDVRGVLTEGRVYGALYPDERSLASLGTICHYFPITDNVTFYLDVLLDDVIVLDIEPTCPEPLKSKLAAAPALYKEVSMSGKGIHLLLPKPKNFDDFPILKKKTALKHEKGYYEFLLNHYVTFTRKSFKIKEDDSEDINKHFTDLASNAIYREREKIILEDEEPEIPQKDRLIDHLMRMDYKKTLKDFNDDWSRYEFGYLAFLYYKLDRLLNSQLFDREKQTEETMSWLLYLTAKEKLPYRPKHDEKRNGMPWLLSESTKIIADRKAQSSETEDQK